MRTLNLHAVPAALLAIASGIGAQSAMAEPTATRGAFEARFEINPSDSAQEIYADIKRTAERICEKPGPRPMNLLRLERACAADLVTAAVQHVSRQDVADLHARDMRG